MTESKMMRKMAKQLGLPIKTLKMKKTKPSWWAGNLFADRAAVGHRWGSPLFNRPEAIIFFDELHGCDSYTQALWFWEA